MMNIAPTKRSVRMKKPNTMPVICPPDRPSDESGAESERAKASGKKKINKENIQDTFFRNSVALSTYTNKLPTLFLFGLRF